MLIHNKPAIYDVLKDKFGVNWDDGIIITYAPDIYCKFPLTEFKVEHEITHITQQEKYGVDEWWNRYLIDVEFRLSQEIEAYLNEARLIKKKVKDRNKRFLYIQQISKDLSSSIYGNIISYEQASKLLHNA